MSAADDQRELDEAIAGPPLTLGTRMLATIGLALMMGLGVALCALGVVLLAI